MLPPEYGTAKAALLVSMPFLPPVDVPQPSTPSTPGALGTLALKARAGRMQRLEEHGVVATPSSATPSQLRLRVV
eukprot:COSAG01_NODE_47921_length_385_cov_16.982517_1_plen_74_part_10